MREGIQHLEQLEGAIAVSPDGGRRHDPVGGVRVLGAVFAHARQISLDVAGILGRAIEGRFQQHDEPRVLTHQVGVVRLHRARLVRGIASVGEHAPALRDGIDTALGSRRRA